MYSKKKQKRRNFTVSTFIKKHFKRLVLCIIATMVISPLLVWLLYSVFPPVIETQISADGILAYLGTTVASIVTLLVCIVSFYQSEKVSKLQEELYYMQHKLDIQPRLNLQVYMEADAYKVCVTNCSQHPAMGVYLSDECIARVLLPNKSVSKKFSYDTLEAALGAYGTLEFDFTPGGYPTAINLIYCDQDGNTLEEIHRFTNDLNYVFDKREYIG